MEWLSIIDTRIAIETCLINHLTLICTRSHGIVCKINNSAPSTSSEKKSTIGFPTPDKMAWNGKQITLLSSLAYLTRIPLMWESVFKSMMQDMMLNYAYLDNWINDLYIWETSCNLKLCYLWFLQLHLH